MIAALFYQLYWHIDGAQTVHVKVGRGISNMCVVDGIYVYDS